MTTMGGGLGPIRAANERYWSWVFSENDGPNHPLKISSGGEAQKQDGNMLIIAGSLPRGGKKDRSLRIPSSIEFIFTPAYSVVSTEADGDGSTDQELINNANRDIGGDAANVSVNGKAQTVSLLEPHLFMLNISICIEGTGRNGRGEGCTKGTPPGITRAAAASKYSIISSKDLKVGDRIEISGRDMSVTYTLL
jgi:hypothetical protein